MTLEELAGVGAEEGPPKLGEPMVVGMPLPEPNEPEHDAIEAPRTTQPAAAVKTRARIITRTVRVLRARVRHVDLGAGCQEFRRLLGHPALGVLAHVLRDLHRAEMRAAHRAEMREFRAVGRQRLVVELLRGVGIEAEVELILPAELEARLREHVVAMAR